jgi:O-antigen/teichoic acid export membrane protein
MVELGRARDLAERQRVYDARVRLLFGAGALAGVAALVAAAVVPVVLGREWVDSAWVVVVLAIATPWRMVLGVTGALMVSGGRAATLVRWEVLRLAATAGVLLLAAQGGLWPFTGAVAAVAIVATVAFNRSATSVSGLVGWRLPTVLAVPALGGVLVAVVAISTR